MVDLKTLIPLYKATISQLDDIIFWLDDSYCVCYASKNPTAYQGLHVDQVMLNQHHKSWTNQLDLIADHDTESRISSGYLMTSEGQFTAEEHVVKFVRFDSTDQAQVKDKDEKYTSPCWLFVYEDSEKLRLQNELEDKATSLTDELSQAESVNLKLARNAQTKDEFLASMSHELRTPLNAILGLCEAMLEGVYGKLDPDQHQPIRQVFSNGHHLLSVISDILDLSKLKAGGISLSLGDIDVEACCFEALQVFRTEMQRKHLAVSVNIEGVYLLNADERWFKQILMNLISNAVKFTKKNQRLGINVGASPITGFMRVSVWDEGIGISEENLPRLFQTFVQLDNSLERAYEGTGLGLSIVSQVMLLHGGEVHVESVLHKGSKFHLDFPWIAELSSTPVSDPPYQDIKSVLLVEDSTIDADRIKRYLKEKDTDVIWDRRGGDAVQLAKDHQPEVIILDLFLPESSGWEILKQLKSDPSLENTPVVVCSVLPRDNSRSESSSIDGYLQKPFSRRALEAVLSKVTQTLFKQTHDNNEPNANDSSNQSDHKELSVDGLGAPKKALVISASENNQASKSIQVSLDSSSKMSSIKEDASYHDAASKDLNRYSILVVDDNLSNIQLVQDYLSRKGYQILTAEDGYQAVQVARARIPDLILMDIQMPHMSGIEATAHIRDDPRISQIPIFALTALAMPGDRERCLEAGMDEYFTKPVSLRGLYRKIKETVES